METKTRRAAAEAGEKKYTTGRPCSKGHNAPRYTSTGICSVCNREGVKAYNQRMRQQVNGKLQGLFTYRLHPEDHAAALAYCQALDMQRGRVPTVPAAPPPATDEAALREQIAAHRRRLVANIDAVHTGPGPDGPLDPGMAATLRSFGMLTNPSSAT